MLGALRLARPARPGALRRSLGAALCVCALVLASHPARAQVTALEVEFQANTPCGSREHFLRELFGRTRRARLAGPGEAASALAIEITRGARDFEGRVTLSERAGTVTDRQVRSANCSELVEALALIAAILVDPDAHERADLPPLPPPKAKAKAKLAPAPSHSRLRFGGGVGASVDSAIAPDLELGPFVELDAVLDTNGRSGLAFGAALERTTSGLAHTENGDAEFRYTAARAFVCPLRWTFGPGSGAVSLAPCVFVDAGELYGRGLNTHTPDHTSLLWLGAGAFARVEYRPVSALVLALDLGGVAPFRRDTFYFDPGYEAFAIPPIGLSIRPGIRVLLP